MRQAKRGEHRTELSTQVDYATGFIEWEHDSDGNIQPEPDTIHIDKDLPIPEEEQKKLVVWCYPCRHCFLKSGLDVWMQDHVKCPLCRTPIESVIQCGTPLKDTRQGWHHERRIASLQKMDTEYAHMCTSYAFWDDVAKRETRAYNEARMNAMANRTPHNIHEVRRTEAVLDAVFRELDTISRSQIENRLTHAELKRVWNV